MDNTQIETMFAEFDNIQAFHKKKFADILSRYSKSFIQPEKSAYNPSATISITSHTDS